MGIILFFMLAIVAGIIYAVIRTRAQGDAAPVVGSIPTTLEVPRRSSSEKYRLAYHYEDVKFYPPEDIISNVPKGVLIPGAELKLKREPQNQNDPKAIALYLAGHKIGYILRGTLQDMIHDYTENSRPVEASFVSLKKSHGEYLGYIELSFYRSTTDIPQDAKRLGYHDIDIKSITPTNPEATPNTPLTGKSIVFSGYFELPINEMMQIAVDAGAILKTRVSKKVDYLVVGKQNQLFTDENGMSSKEGTATKLNEQGEANIRIINEKTFIELTQPKK